MDITAIPFINGQCHMVEELESGTMILECNDGSYESLEESEVMSEIVVK